MPTEQFEKLEESVEVEERVDQIERILPTLSTKRDLKATEKRLRTEIADAEERLRKEAADTEERLRTHFDVVAEGLRDLVRIVAEGVSTLLKRNRQDSQK